MSEIFHLKGKTTYDQFRERRKILIGLKGKLVAINPL